MGFRKFLAAISPNESNEYAICLMRGGANWERDSYDAGKNSSPTASLTVGEAFAKKFANAGERTPLSQYFRNLEVETNLTGDPRIVPISSLPETHEAVNYLRARKIPEHHWGDLFFTNEFSAWCRDNGLLRPKSKVDGSDVSKPSIGTPRIIIPMRKADSSLIGIQGRAIRPVDNQIRYLTVKVDQHYPKIWGMDKIDWASKDDGVFVVEGAFDAMCVTKNVVAMNGSEVSTLPEELRRKTPIYVFDNEPRSKIIAKKVLGMINRGEHVVIWDACPWGEYKDINSMIIDGGATPEEITDYLTRKTMSGVKAKLLFSHWIKCEV
jgi:hypothetical protein